MATAEEGVSVDRAVAPTEYDCRYFFASCEGYKEFQASNGRRIGARFQKALDLAQVRPGQRVLDIGCGRGELVFHSALRGSEAVGIDYAEEAVRIALEALAAFPEDVQQRSSIFLMNALEMDFADGSFDVAFMSDVVEHVYPQEMREMMAEAARVLRPGGVLVVHTCPNRLFYDLAYKVYTRHVHRAVCRIAELAGYVSYVIGPMLSVGPEYPRTEDEQRVHVNEQTPRSLREGLEEAGFRVRKTEYWEMPGQWPYASWRLMFELMALDALRYLRPFSYGWPLNRLFTNHIWMVAEKV